MVGDGYLRSACYILLELVFCSFSIVSVLPRFLRGCFKAQSMSSSLATIKICYKSTRMQIRPKSTLTEHRKSSLIRFGFAQHKYNPAPKQGVQGPYLQAIK